MKKLFGALTALTMLILLFPTLALAKDDASITIADGHQSYTKTFGDEDFTLDGITAEPADATLTYRVRDSKNPANTTVDNDKVITVSDGGKVHIVGAGSATIFVSTGETAQYNAAASKTVSVTISRAAYAPEEVSGAALCGESGTVDLLALVKSGGSVGEPQKTDADGILSGALAVDGDKKLHFTFRDDVLSVGKSATVSIPVTGAADYNDYNISVRLTMGKKALTVRAANVSKAYGEADPPFSVYKTGSDTFSITCSFSREAGDDPGEYAIEANGSATVKRGAVDVTDKCDISYGVGKLTITRANIAPAVSAEGGGWTYGSRTAMNRLSITGNTGGGQTAYHYNTTGDTAAGAVLDAAAAGALDAGSYYLFATVGETKYYNAATTAAVPFTVSKAEWTANETAASVERGQSIESLELSKYIAPGGNPGTPSLYGVNPDTVTVSLSGTKLKIVTKDEIKTGLFTVTVPATDATNYDNYSITAKVTVTPKVVSAPTIVLDPDTFQYTGAYQTPSVTVWDGKTRIDASEYTVSYQNHKDASTDTSKAKVIISDKAGGEYTVNGETTFTIAPADITPVPTVNITGWAYRGYAESKNAPAVTGKPEGSGAASYFYNTTGLTTGGEAWGGAMNDLGVGDYYVYAKIAASANYKAATTAAAPFSVTKTEWTANETAASVERGQSIEELELSDYRAPGGSLGTPSVYGVSADTMTVSLSGTKLSVATTAATTAGQYTVTVPVTGAANYADYGIIVTVTVEAKQVTPTVRLEYESAPYTGEEKKPGVTVLDGNEPIPASEYTVEYRNNVNAGTRTALVTVTDKSGGNYGFTTATAWFTITKADAACLVKPAAIDNLTYNGSPHTLITAGTATGGKMQYRAGESGAWSETLPSKVDAGAYTVYYYVAGDSNHNNSAQEYVRSSIAKTKRADASAGMSVAAGKSATLDLGPYLAAGGTPGTPAVYGINADAQIIDTKRLRITPAADAPLDGQLTVNVPVIGATNYEDYNISVAVTVVPVSYAVTVTGGTGGGSYVPGASVSVAATGASDRRLFDKWTTATEGVTFADATAAETTFTMPARDVAVTANYKAAPGAKFTVTVENGTASESSVAEGASVSVTANAAPDGKVFDKWTTSADGLTFADAAAVTTTFTMPAADVTVTANYKSASGTGTLTGVVTIYGSTLVGQTLSAVVTGSNNTGTLFYQWKSDGANIAGATGSTFYLTNSQRWTTITCEVTSSSHSGSIISAATASVQAESSSNSRASVSLNYSRLELYVDDYGYLIATVSGTYSGSISWSSDNTKVVSVDSDGNFNANRKGTAYITATLNNGNSSSCYVRVSEWTETTPRNQSTSTGGSGRTSETTVITVPGRETPTQTVDSRDGSRSKVTSSADGTTSTIRTDKNGVLTSASVTYSATAVDSARYSGNSLLLPTEVRPANDASAAPEVSIVLPATSQSVRVKIPLSPATQGAVAIVENLFGPDEVIKSSSVQNGDLTFKLRASAVVKVIDRSKSFYDVSGSDWYGDAVAWATSHDVMNGVSEHMFDPNGVMNRAMMTQIMYNYANASSTGVTDAFSDVSAGDWYGRSVTWAAENGIAHVSGDSFGAESSLTREDMAYMLYNYCNKKGYTTTTSASTWSFADNESISDWARPAMTWAVGAGIIKGTQNGTSQVVLDPQGTATRAQLATIMRRFCENVEQ